MSEEKKGDFIIIDEPWDGIPKEPLSEVLLQRISEMLGVPPRVFEGAQTKPDGTLR